MSREEQRLAELEELVGGVEALARLTIEPLPEELLDPETLPSELRSVVAEVLRQCDEVAGQWFDTEARTALHRLVTVTAAARPAAVGHADVDRTAASLTWMVGRGNGFVGPRYGVHTVTNRDLFGHFRQASHVVEAYAAQLLPMDWVRGNASRSRSRSDYLLGRPEWLVSRRRAAIVRERDDLFRRLEAAAGTDADAQSHTDRYDTDTAAYANPPPLETLADGDDGLPDWERSLRLLERPHPGA